MSNDCIGEIGYQDYIIVTDITEATHWLSKPDLQSHVREYITPNKAYELIKQIDDLDEEEYFIRSNDGYLSCYYMCHKGDFIKIKEN